MHTFKFQLKKISAEQVFMGSILLVNAGNYLYNLLLGRILGPNEFADAALQITLLLVLSFLGMTFQLSTAKFSAGHNGTNWYAQKRFLFILSTIAGLGIGAILVLSAPFLQRIFNMQSSMIFVFLGVGVPIYFIMSVSRGIYQGRQAFKTLSITYQFEMWSRLLITMALLLLTGLDSAIAVALGILISFVFGLFPTNFKGVGGVTKEESSLVEKKKIYRFMMVTAGYELSQIIINNSDVLLVKHYFEGTEAGLYSALALIGRVVYFVAWMFVMLLLPKVVEKQKNGETTTPLLFKYMSLIGILSVFIVAMCYAFPDLIIQLMFGSAYVSMAPLLWQYAIATSLFALANIFAYYFLSLDHYLPVLFSGLFGLLQVVLIAFFHDSLLMVVRVQILAMVALLIFQISYFIIKVQLSNKG